MKFFRLIFLLFTLVIIVRTSGVFAQPAYNEIKPSVNAQQFFSSVSATNSLQSGQLSVNIPLFNLQGRGINVPVSINFNAEGITHYSDASPIGLGWSLLAGGVITRTIRGSADSETAKYSERAWHYEEQFLQNKVFEEDQNHHNIVGLALNAALADSEPDLFSYSFLGHTGDIYTQYNEDRSASRTLYPDKSFQIVKTVEGYKITTNDGTEYLFGEKEMNSLNVMSWFLTEIKTLQGGKITFDYVDVEIISNNEEEHNRYNSKRLTKIDFEFGYVIFGGTIELFNKNGSLIKGYKLIQSSFDDDRTGGKTWLRLDGIKEYDQNRVPLPPYEFKYDYFFGHTPGTNLLKGSWAHNPAAIASMDMSFNGDLDPWMTCDMSQTDNYGVCIPYALGYNLSFDSYDAAIYDYLCLTQIKFPTGGSESYYYGSHDYSRMSASNDDVQADNHILGKRLSQKVITDENNNTQTVTYRYCLHDNNHLPLITTDGLSQPRLITSGVLVNPSVHTSTFYTPVEDYQRPRLKAIPYDTKQPQNTKSVSPVLYTEVEEEFSSGLSGHNGKNVYYFEKIAAIPAANYVYINNLHDSWTNNLIPVSNTLYGKKTYPANTDLVGESEYNRTYLAYPVGSFYVPHNKKGRILQEVTLNSMNVMVKKTENIYNTGWIGPMLYGLIVKKISIPNNSSSSIFPIIDPIIAQLKDQPLIEGNQLNSDETLMHSYYLISQTQTEFGANQLLGKTVTHYFGSDSLVEKQSFGYNNLNLPSFSSMISSKNDYLETSYKYVNDNPSGISTSSAVLQNMIAKNMIGIPLKTEKSVNYVTKEGSVTNYGSNLYPSDIRELAGSTYNEKIIFDLYDSNGNILQYHTKSNYYVSYIWGYNQAYPVVKIEGMAYADIPQSIKAAIIGYTFSGSTSFKDINTDVQGLKSLLTSFMTGNNCMVTFYTYAPLIGKTSQTDTNGITTYYEYDSFGRLKTIRDNNSNILNTYEYNYKN